MKTSLIIGCTESNCDDHHEAPGILAVTLRAYCRPLSSTNPRQNIGRPNVTNALTCSADSDCLVEGFDVSALASLSLQSSWTLSSWNFFQTYLSEKENKLFKLPVFFHILSFKGSISNTCIAPLKCFWRQGCTNVQFLSFFLMLEFTHLMPRMEKKTPRRGATVRAHARNTVWRSPISAEGKMAWKSATIKMTTQFQLNSSTDEI